MKRQCGECNLCCKLSEVKEGDFFKPACESCKFLNKTKNGCSIFGKDERPNICSSYECAWLRGFGSENDRPDKSGVMLSISKFNNGTWIFVQETKKFAHLTTGKDIIIDIANKLNLPVIISDFDSKSGEDFGDYVVIRKDLESRAKYIKGNFIYKLTDNLSIYKLIIN